MKYLEHFFGGLAVICLIVTFNTPYIKLQILSFLGVIVFGIISDLTRVKDEKTP